GMSGIWGSGRFGTGPCGEYCLSWGSWETVHEGALIIMPGYDLGTCMSGRGDCSALDWGLAIFGTIPGEKLLVIGVKATIAAAVARRVPNTTVLGNGQTTRVVPFAERTGARTLDNGLTEAEWNALTPRQQWKVNDGQLRQHIN